MALYADENYPLRVIEELRRLGHDVVTALTLNLLDFKRLHREVPDHAGIIICTEDPDRLGQAQRIVESIDKEGYLRGQLIRVYRPS
jgi:hypothetical protein